MLESLKTKKQEIKILMGKIHICVQERTDKQKIRYVEENPLEREGSIKSL